MNLNAMWAAIQAEAKKIWQKDIVPVAQYFKPLAIATGQELAQLALGAVVAQAPALISGQEKFSAAVASVQSQLASASKTAAITDIGIAVQAAHDYIATGSAPPVTSLKPAG